MECNLNRNQQRVCAVVSVFECVCVCVIACVCDCVRVGVWPIVHTVIVDVRVPFFYFFIDIELT